MNPLNKKVILNITKSQKTVLTTYVKAVESHGFTKGLVVGSAITAGSFIGGCFLSKAVDKIKDDESDE